MLVALSIRSPFAGATVPAGIRFRRRIGTFLAARETDKCDKCRCNSNEIVQHEEQRTTVVVLYTQSDVLTAPVEVKSILVCFIKKEVQGVCDIGWVAASGITLCICA